MSKGVHRVDAPLVTGTVVFSKTDTVNGRVTQVDVGAGHINLGAHHHGAFGMFAFPHFAEKTQVFFNRTIAIGRILARFGERAAIGVHFFGSLLINVSKTGFYQMFCAIVRPSEIVTGKVKIVLFTVLPIKTQPLNGFFNGINIFLVFFNRVRIVKAHMAIAAVITG